MCEFKVCRICLTNDSKFYRLDEYKLKSYYEEVTNLAVPDKDGIPQYFCYECAALLYKFHSFREKCFDGQRVLRDMLCSGPITYAGICELNTRKIHKCQYGHLEILTASNRVKTCLILHTKTAIDKDYNDLKEEIVDFDYSDGPFSENDDYGCKDPPIDPVAEENNIDFVAMKPDVVSEYKEIICEVKTVSVLENSETELKDDLKITEEVEKKSTKVVKNKKELKRKKQIGRTRHVKKRYTKRKKKCESDYNSDSSEEILSRIKSKKTKAVSSDTGQNQKYKFNKPMSKLKNLAFLDSGFWKKSSLSEEEALRNFEAKAHDRKYLNAAFKCTFCYKGFSQMSMLERHIPQRHGEAAGKLVCRFCKMRFKSTYFLNKHMRQHYTKYECLRCDLVCSLENSALFHEEYHNGVVRKCPHCDKEFKHLSTFYTHLRTHRSKHMCALCGESFVSELGLRLHRKAKHNTDTEPAVKTLPDNMYCDICQMKFETKDAYDKHLAHSAMHTDQNKMSQENLLGEDDENEEDDRNSDEDHKTRELLKRRSRVEKTLCAVRKSHLPRRTCKKPTTCHHCGKHFDTQSACMKHHLSTHPGTSFFSPKDRVICEVCGASLAPGSVANHLNQHTRSKMYTCDTCGRSFTTSTMLRTHLVTHTGEKRYACSLCDKRFTQNGSLSLHYRTFHLKQPYPKRNRRKKMDKPSMEIVNGNAGSSPDVMQAPEGGAGPDRWTVLVQRRHSTATAHK